MILSNLARSQSALQGLHLTKFSLGPKWAKTKNSSHRQLESFPAKFISGATFSATLAHRTLKISVAECITKTTQASDGNRNVTNNKKCSAWDLLSHILKKEWLPLLIALTSAVVLAVCHALMPIGIEDVIQCLRSLLSGEQLVSENVHTPTIRLAVLCLAQSIFTSIYIAALAIVFKSSSSRLDQATSTTSIRADSRKGR